MTKTFLKENKKYHHLSFSENSIYGKVGFSLTNSSLQLFLLSLYNYCAIHGICKFFLGHDTSDWASSLSKDVVLDTCKNLGLRMAVIDRPASLPELVWLTREGSDSKKSIGMYLSSDCHDPAIVSLLLYDQHGMPLSEAQILDIAKCSCVIESSVVAGYEVEDHDTLNVDLYLKYLLDKNQLKSLIPNQSISIDTMFGSSEALILKFSQHIAADKAVNIFNKYSDKPRIYKYLPKPTGSLLKWYTTYHNITKQQYFFGIDGDGDSLGVYDLLQELELSPSSVALLLLKSLKLERPDLTGTVVLSRMISFKVEKLAKLYGLNTIRTEKHLNGIEKGDNVVFYADEAGRYYFGSKDVCGNPLIAMERLISLGSLEKKSLGELVDQITSNDIKKLGFYNKIIVPLRRVTMESLVTLIKNTFPKAKKLGKNMVELKVSPYSRCIFFTNYRESIIEVFIESNNKELALQLGKTVTDYLKELGD